MNFEYSLKIQYCTGCCNCVQITWNNFYEYLWLYPVAYPTIEAEADLKNRDCNLCNVCCTISCLPIKCICCLPVCPCFTFCPSTCQSCIEN